MNECMNERMKALPDINQYQRKLLCCIYGIRYVRGLSIYLHIYISYFIIILYHIISFYCIVIYVYSHTRLKQSKRVFPFPPSLIHLCFPPHSQGHYLSVFPPRPLFTGKNDVDWLSRQEIFNLCGAGFSWWLPNTHDLTRTLRG